MFYSYNSELLLHIFSNLNLWFIQQQTLYSSSSYQPICRSEFLIISTPQPPHTDFFSILKTPSFLSSRNYSRIFLYSSETFLLQLVLPFSTLSFDVFLRCYWIVSIKQISQQSFLLLLGTGINQQQWKKLKTVLHISPKITTESSIQLCRGPITVHTFS